MSKDNLEWFLKNQRTEPGQSPIPPQKIISNDDPNKSFKFIERTMKICENETKDFSVISISDEEALSLLHFGLPQQPAIKVILRMIGELIEKSYDKDNTFNSEDLVDYDILLQNSRTIAETLLLVDDVNEKSHMWTELRRLFQSISALRERRNDDPKEMKSVDGITHRFSLNTGVIVGRRLGKHDLSEKRRKAGEGGAKRKKESAEEWKIKSLPIISEVLKEKDKQGRLHTASSAAGRLQAICKEAWKTQGEHIAVPTTKSYVAEWIRDVVCKDKPNALRQIASSRRRATPNK